jgi:hypothetical protein
MEEKAISLRTNVGCLQFESELPIVEKPVSAVRGASLEHRLSTIDIDGLSGYVTRALTA